MVGDEGFEPSNGGIKIRCLDQLGESPIDLLNQKWSGKRDSNSRSPAPKAGALNQTKLHPELFGGDGQDRTDYLWLAKPLLSQMSYTPKLF